MCSDRSPCWFAARDQALESERASRRDPSAASASTYQKVHTANAFSGTRIVGVTVTEHEIAAPQVFLDRAHRSGKARSVARRKSSSCSSSRLASRSSPPKVAAKLERLAFQARR